MRSLEFWGQHSGSTVLENFTGELLVADERNRPDCMRAWRAHLIGPARDHWDLIDLEHLCGILPSGRALAECFPEGEVLEEQMPGFLVDLDLGVEALHKAFGKNSTRNLRRSRRLLEEAGTPFRFESRPDIDDPLFDEIGRVHTVRQQELAAKGRTDRDLPFVDPVSRRVLRRALQCEAEAGHLRVHTLRIGERLAAFGLVIQKEARAVFWLIGFDAEFQQFSPSRLLFAEVYGSGMDSRDLRSVNLLLGHTRTKEELSTTRYAATRFRLVNDWSLRSRLRRGLLEQLKRLARTLQRPDRPRRVPSP